MKKSIFNEDGSLKSKEEIQQESFFEMLDRNPHLVDQLAENIEKGLQTFDTQAVEIVYSAHSLPVSFIQDGDPYVDHIKQTIAAIETITQHSQLVGGLLFHANRVVVLGRYTPHRFCQTQNRGGDGALEDERQQQDNPHCHQEYNDDDEHVLVNLIVQLLCRPVG